MEEEKNNLNIDEMKIEYNGKIYSFLDAVKNNIICYQYEDKELRRYGESEYDVAYITKQDAGYRILPNNVSLIIGESKFVLNKNDFIKLDKADNFIGLESYPSIIGTINNSKKINIQNLNITEIKDKKYIAVGTDDIVEATLDNQHLYLTKKIIVDIDSGKIVGGYMCSENNTKELPEFSCNINGNNMVVKDGENQFIFTENDKVDFIQIHNDEDKPVNIKYNGKEIFIPKENEDLTIKITKIDDTVFFNNKKSSGVNFFFKQYRPQLIKTDIDDKYANAGILNLQINNKKLKDQKYIDYTIYNNNLSFIKHDLDNFIYTVNNPNNSNKYQLVNRYILPETKRYKNKWLYSCNLEDEDLLDYININNSRSNINNQAVNIDEQLNDLSR